MVLATTTSSGGDRGLVQASYHRGARGHHVHAPRGAPRRRDGARDRQGQVDGLEVAAAQLVRALLPGIDRAAPLRGAQGAVPQAPAARRPREAGARQVARPRGAMVARVARGQDPPRAPRPRRQRRHDLPRGRRGQARPLHRGPEGVRQAQAPRQAPEAARRGRAAGEE